MTRFLYIAFCAFVLLFLSSCTDCKDKCPRCIAADDFDSLKFSVSSQFKQGSDEFKVKNESSDGKHNKQVIKWKSTGFCIRMSKIKNIKAQLKMTLKSSTGYLNIQKHVVNHSYFL